MKLDLNKTDALYIAVLILTTYFVLTVLPDIPLSSYAKISALNDTGIVQEILTLPVLLGIFTITVMYLLARIMFEQNRFSVLFASLLLLSSAAFINNFLSGSASDLTITLLGSPVLPSFAFTKLVQILALLPLALFSMYLLLKKNRMSEFVVGIASVLVSLFTPLVGALVLMVFTADGLQRFGNKKEVDIAAGSLIAAAATLFIVPVSMQTAVLAILVGIVTVAVLFAFSSHHKLVYALCVLLLFLSLESGMMQALSATRVDRETISAITELKGLNGRIAVASYYAGNVSDIAYVRNGQNVSTTDAFNFLFTTNRPDFNYLLLDTRVLDNPQYYASLGNTTTGIETFAFVQQSQQNNETDDFFTTIDNNQMYYPVDSSGDIIGNTVIVNGMSESFFRLVQLNATDQSLDRYIDPHDDSDKNVFKLLFSTQFGQLNGTTVTEVWESNSSMLRLYKFS